MGELTEAQKRYFRILETLNPSPALQRAIAAAQHDLAERNREKRNE